MNCLTEWINEKNAIRIDLIVIHRLFYHSGGVGCDWIGNSLYRQDHSEHHRCHNPRHSERLMTTVYLIMYNDGYGAVPLGGYPTLAEAKEILAEMRENSPDSEHWILNPIEVDENDRIEE